MAEIDWETHGDLRGSITTHSVEFHIQLLQDEGDCRVTSHRTFRDRHDRHARLALFALRFLTIDWVEATDCVSMI